MNSQIVRNKRGFELPEFKSRASRRASSTRNWKDGLACSLRTLKLGATLLVADLKMSNFYGLCVIKIVKRKWNKQQLIKAIVFRRKRVHSIFELRRCINDRLSSLTSPFEICMWADNSHFFSPTGRKLQFVTVVQLPHSAWVLQPSYCNRRLPSSSIAGHRPVTVRLIRIRILW